MRDFGRVKTSWEDYSGETMGLRPYWTDYKKDLRNPWTIILSVAWGLLLVFALSYVDAFFYYAGMFFNYCGTGILFLAYLPRTALASLLKLVGFISLPENVLTLIIVIGLAIPTLPASKILFKFMDYLQDGLFKLIRWKK